MKKNFLIAGIITSLVSLALHASFYFFLLKDIFAKYPAGSEEFLKQLHRPPDQLIPWAMAVTALTTGFLITTIIKWSGAVTFVSGIKSGFPVALLFWGSVNFGLYASSNFFSLEGVFADYACSVTSMTISAAVSATVLSQRK